MDEQSVITSTQKWVESFVLQLNLCPFAHAEIKNNTVRFEVTSAESIVKLLQDLEQELIYLKQHSEIETTLLIHPYILNDFALYNDFLSLCDEFLIANNLEGVYQIASFHPNYQFADTKPNDAENFSNRSPYPMLHILRESSLEQAISKHPNSEDIPAKNIKTLNNLGFEQCKNRLEGCYN